MFSGASIDHPRLRGKMCQQYNKLASVTFSSGAKSLGGLPPVEKSSSLLARVNPCLEGSPYDILLMLPAGPLHANSDGHWSLRVAPQPELHSAHCHLAAASHASGVNLPSDHGTSCLQHRVFIGRSI